MPEVSTKDGFLVILDDWEDSFSAPIRYRAIWPIGVPASDYPELVGRRARHVGQGLFNAGGQLIALANREKTKPIDHEEKRLPKPKWTRAWERGDWRR
jgi:hypothetical protein